MADKLDVVLAEVRAAREEAARATEEGRRAQKMLTMVLTAGVGQNAAAVPKASAPNDFLREDSLSVWLSKSGTAHLHVGKRFILMLGPRVGPWVWRHRVGLINTVWLFGATAIWLWHALASHLHR